MGEACFRSEPTQSACDNGASLPPAVAGVFAAWDVQNPLKAIPSLRERVVDG